MPLISFKKTKLRWNNIPVTFYQIYISLWQQTAIPLIFNSSNLDALQAEFLKLDFNRTTFTPLFVYYGTPQTLYQILTADSVYMKELLIDWNFHIKNEHKSLKGWNPIFNFHVDKNLT